MRLVSELSPSHFGNINELFKLGDTESLFQSIKITRFGSRFSESTSFVGWPLTNLVASRKSLKRSKVLIKLVTAVTIFFDTFRIAV